MPTLQLTDIQLGKLSSVWEYMNGQYQDVDPLENFLNRFNDKKTDWQTKETTQSIFYVTDDFPEDVQAYHKNYIEYLERCWGDHLGVVFTPDILWYTLLGELISIIKNNVEEYRHLFSESDEKEEIALLTVESLIISLPQFTKALREYVPTDIELFLPEFSTTTGRSAHAMLASFCDMCSPYYNYSMLACGFPAIDIRGEDIDYQKILDNWGKLRKLFVNERAYMDRVALLLQSIINNKTDAEFWRNMFSLEHCGSGSQVEVRGWWTDLYFENKPSLAYPGNFSPHVAKVPYKSLHFKPVKDLEMQEGLFFSQMNGDFLEPEFGFIVQEKIEPEPEALSWLSWR